MKSLFSFCNFNLKLNRLLFVLLNDCFNTMSVKINLYFGTQLNNVVFYLLRSRN